MLACSGCGRHGFEPGAGDAGGRARGGGMPRVDAGRDAGRDGGGDAAAPADAAPDAVVDAGVDAGPPPMCRTVVPEMPGALAVPRLIAPLSAARVTSRRPGLRWVLPAGADGGGVELCR